MKKPYSPRTPRKFIGAYRPRIEGLEKASGKVKFVDDLTIKSRYSNMLYAKVLRSPHAHARIRKMDVSRARALAGVHAVMTYQDPEFSSLKPTSAGWTDGVDTVSYDRMMWRHFRDRRVLGDYARWVTDEVGAVVAAESEEIAEEALKLIEVDWEVLPFVLDPLEAMKPGAPSVHPEISPSNILPKDEVGGSDVFVDRGNIDKAFAEADAVVEGTSIHHNATQASLDNWCCLVDWTDEQLTVVSNSYEADQSRMHISEMLDLPLHKVRIISSYVGGQFGRGDTGDQPFFLFTALLSKKTGRPVKFRHSRRESFHDSRQPAIYFGKLGAKRDGTITGMYFKSVGNSGAYADHTVFALKFAPTEITEVALAHIPNIKMESYGVYTNMLPACMMRGVGNSQFNLIFGHVVDMLAEKLGMDPIELALKNFGHEWGSLPDKSLTEVLKQGAERIGWREKRHLPGQGPIHDRTKRRGVGFSFHPAWHAEWQEVRRGLITVGITVNADGTVMLEAPTVETGTGSNTCNVLGCAEALAFLGVTPEQISWSPVVDTQTSLKDCVQTDSAVSFLQAEVMAHAADEVRKQVLEKAALILKTKPSELEIDKGRISYKAEPNRNLTLRELFYQGDLAPVVVRIGKTPNSERTGVPYIANFSEVEVDTETGRVQVLKMIVLNDCGTVMFASGAEGQQLGGQVMGMGEALTEEIIYDQATGIPLNFNWIDYKIPTMADMPDIDPVLLEVWKGAGEYGACGIGEGTVTCTPRSVLNAIYNAIGVRIDDIPIKPEKVLRALGKA
ncbi:MAG: molybdopterin-dependent oxidoreductase [Oligoflexia bacterium]|nr:molybdopterin-dependent oxidoreductase [Oligoflexia bacterium]